MAQLLPVCLRLNLSLFLISILGLMSSDASLNSGDSSEDEPLKQALFLVNLLKSEYIRVLRENTEMKKQGDSEEQNNSTCPTTVQGPSSPGASTASTLPTNSITLSDREVESTSPKSTLPSSQTSAYPAHRRMMIPTDADKQPQKYFGRRMMPEHADIYETPAASTSALPTTTGQDLTTPSSKLNLTSKDFVTEASGPKVPDRKPMRKVNEAGNNLENRIIKLTATKPSTTESDNVMSQVARELINEFKGEKNEKLRHDLGKIHMWLEKTDTPTFLKSTMKVYLEGSSRFPVPLPENHAFCHTNPYNPLCRTFIG